MSEYGGKLAIDGGPKAFSGRLGFHTEALDRIRKSVCTEDPNGKGWV